MAQSRRRNRQGIRKHVPYPKPGRVCLLSIYEYLEDNITVNMDYKPSIAHAGASEDKLTQSKPSVQSVGKRLSPLTTDKTRLLAHTPFGLDQVTQERTCEGPDAITADLHPTTPPLDPDRIGSSGGTVPEADSETEPEDRKRSTTPPPPPPPFEHEVHSFAAPRTLELPLPSPPPDVDAPLTDPVHAFRQAATAAYTTAGYSLIEAVSSARQVRTLLEAAGRARQEGAGSRYGDESDELEPRTSDAAWALDGLKKRADCDETRVVGLLAKYAGGVRVDPGTMREDLLVALGVAVRYMLAYQGKGEGDVGHVDAAFDIAGRAKGQGKEGSDSASPRDPAPLTHDGMME